MEDSTFDMIQRIWRDMDKGSKLPDWQLPNETGNNDDEDDD